MIDIHFQQKGLYQKTVIVAIGKLIIIDGR
jgi:hypothetical protein